MATDLAIREESTALTTANPEHAASALAHILATGDLSKLSNEQRVAYYLEQCRSLGLNSLSRPFDWLMLDNKLVLYPNKSCAEQLRRQHQISVKITRRDVVGDLFVCEVEGRRPNGVTDQASKYVPLTGYNSKTGTEYRLRGKDLANAFAKAETGAKRRLVLSMIGLSAPPDADEVENVRYVVVDGAGRILDNPTEEQKALAADPNLARAIHEPTYETTGATVAPEVAGTADQGPTPAELERPAPPTKRTSLTCDADHYRAAYFAAVDGTPLATDLGRKAFMAAYTSGFSPALRTDSLSAFLKRASDRQAADLVAQAKVEADEIREDMASRQGDEDDDDQAEAF